MQRAGILNPEDGLGRQILQQELGVPNARDGVGGRQDRAVAVREDEVAVDPGGGRDAAGVEVAGRELDLGDLVVDVVAVDVDVVEAVEAPDLL